MNAALGLSRFGSKAKAAIPVLVETLTDQRETQKAMSATSGLHPEHWGAIALICIGPDSIPALIKVLKGRHLTARHHAAEALSYFGSKANSATTALIEAARERDVRLRQLALGVVKPDPKVAVPALTAALNGNRSRGAG